MNDYRQDPTMLSLFRQEMEANSAVISEQTLAIESAGESPAKLEKLMRAAHSIKGAARIIGIEPVVEVAHSLETSFVAAQEGKVTLAANDFDLILKCADLFSEMAIASDENLQNLGAEGVQELQALALALEQIGSVELKLEVSLPVAGKVTPPQQVSKPLATSSPENESKANGAKPEDLQHNELSVQISADNLDHLLGLASEVLVESRWISPAASRLRQLKCKHLDLLSHTSQASSDKDEGAAARKAVMNMRSGLSQCHDLIDHLLEEMESRTSRSTETSQELYQQVLDCRMRPFSSTLSGQRRMVRDVARELGKQVNFEVRGEAARVDREILAKIDAPVGHMLRNALDHGIESPQEREAAGKPAEAHLVLEARHSNGMLFISVEDDGRGICVEQIRKAVEVKGLAPDGMARNFSDEELMEFLFLPGFSMKEEVTAISGRGVGLDAVRDAVNEVGGTARMISTLGKGARLELQLPVTLSLVRALLVEISGQKFGLPLNRIEAAVEVSLSDVVDLEGKPCFRHHGDLVCLIRASQVLELDPSNQDETSFQVIVIRDRDKRYGLIVDALVEEKQLRVLPLPEVLGRVNDVNAGTILEDGSLALILDLEDLLQSAERLLRSGRLTKTNSSAKEKQQHLRSRILVVDDSLTVREVQRQILETQGHDVVLAVDGIDGWNALRGGDFDLVISDVDMPRMDGIEFVKRIRADQKLQGLPVVIISYKDHAEDCARGLEVGANCYLTKGCFQDDKFINTINDLLKRD
ncbi:MAG: hybrid sensor histidine kinase/response regulator [Planctomycetota bacterium]